MKKKNWKEFYDHQNKGFDNNIRKFYKMKPKYKSSEDSMALLQSYMENGTIWWDENEKEFLGEASDGTIVGFGYSKDGVARYLTKNPNPESW